MDSLPVRCYAIGQEHFVAEDGGVARRGGGTQMGLRRTTFVALIASLVFVTAGCDWSMFAFGPAHTGYNPGESTIGVGNVATLQEAWTATLGPPQGGSVTPVTAGGMVYATSDASPFKLEAFDA